MDIEKLEITRFGCLRDVAMDDLGPGVEVREHLPESVAPQLELEQVVLGRCADLVAGGHGADHAVQLRDVALGEPSKLADEREVPVATPHLPAQRGLEGRDLRLTGVHAGSRGVDPRSRLSGRRQLLLQLELQACHGVLIEERGGHGEVRELEPDRGVRPDASDARGRPERVHPLAQDIHRRLPFDGQGGEDLRIVGGGRRSRSGEPDDGGDGELDRAYDQDLRLLLSQRSCQNRGGSRGVGATLRWVRAARTVE